MLIVFDNIETIRSWLDGINRLRYGFNPFDTVRDVVLVQNTAKVLRAIYNHWAFNPTFNPTFNNVCILDIVAPTSTDTLKSLIEILDESYQQEKVLFTRTQDADIRAWLNAIRRAILKKCFKRSIFAYWCC